MFPRVHDADTQAGSGNGSTITVDYPTNLSAGDLVLLVGGNDGRRNVTDPDDPDFVFAFRRYLNGGGTGNFVTAWWGKKVSDGSESGGTFTFTLSTADQFIWRTYRISGWEGTLGTTFDNASTSGAVCRGIAESLSATSDPPSLDPNNWGAEDTYWFATEVRKGSGTLISYPLTLERSHQSSGSHMFGVCATEDAGSSLDPGAFSYSNSDTWIASTIAIRPAPYFPRNPAVNFQHPAVM